MSRKSPSHNSPAGRPSPGRQQRPHAPLVFDVRALPRQPGSERTQTRTVPAPADLRVGMAWVPEGADLELVVRFESVTEGVLVTATAMAPVEGECARCLEPVSSTTDVRFQELFAYGQDGGAGEEGRYALDGDLLDLEPVLRDALVLALPLAPLCRDDCPGLCAECGVLLAEAGPDHGHAAATHPRWAALERYLAQAGPGGPDGQSREGEEG